MKLDVVDTRDISADDYKVRLIRLVDIGGVRYLQMMGSKHDAMPYTWSDGVIMTCPATLTLDDVALDPELYYRGYADGCCVCDDMRLSA